MTKNEKLLQKHNFFCYSIYRCLPLFAQERYYDIGRYWGTEEAGVHSESIDASVIETYSVLAGLPSVTEIRDAGDCFFMLDNELPHYPFIFKLPDYELVLNGNSKETIAHWVEAHPGLNLETEEQIAKYHTNLVSLKLMGEYFDYLREQGVYDNSRIILVADHGFPHHHFDDLVNAPIGDIEGYTPLLMVKDFDSHGFTDLNERMTNADVPVLALKGIVSPMINPFTGTEMDAYGEEQKRGVLRVIASTRWNPEDYPENTFDTDEVTWWEVDGDVNVHTSWRKVR